MIAPEDILRPWLTNMWLCWGVGPIVASNIGFFVTTICLGLLSKCQSDASFISYSKDKPRSVALKVTQSKVSFAVQLRYCFWTMVGPSQLFNGVVSAVISNYVFPFDENKDPIVPTLAHFLFQLTTLLLVGDFGLYWGHRIQHQIPYLWKNFHSLHHTIDTPSCVSTLYINEIDAFLQAVLPILVSSLVVRPHPITYYVYIALRLCDNAVNHSGLKPNILVDIFTLKFLPFRASVGHHDSHHKYSGYTGPAKNYAEFFWIWDYMFGTLSTGTAHKLE